MRDNNETIANYREFFRYYQITSHVKILKRTSAGPPTNSPPRLPPQVTIHAERTVAGDVNNPPILHRDRPEIE